MSIFNQTATHGELPLYKEPDADFVAGKLIVDADGQPVMLEGRAALALWVRKALDPQSARFAHAAHSAAYGNEFETLLGSGRDVAENRMREMIGACLRANPYITQVDGFVFTHTDSGLHAAFRVGTIYGDIFSESEADAI